METIQANSEKLFHTIASLKQDEELIQAANKVTNKLREVVSKDIYKDKFKTNPNAMDDVSEEALQKIFDANEDIIDIRINTNLSNCLVFHTIKLAGTIIDDEVLAIRKQVDDIVTDRVKKIFADDTVTEVKCSGHFLYPPPGGMGWHTNSRKLGWRFYITLAEEPGKSFFRYRDPDNGEIITCYDDGWDFRLFRIIDEKPLWHAVYAETRRWSLGYTVSF